MYIKHAVYELSASHAYPYPGTERSLVKDQTVTGSRLVINSNGSSLAILKHQVSPSKNMVKNTGK